VTYKVGDVVEIGSDDWDNNPTRPVTITNIDYDLYLGKTVYLGKESKSGMKWSFFEEAIRSTTKKPDAINPNYYILPNGRELQELSGWLTSNGGQAVQYVFRSSRIDGIFKQDTTEGRIEDLDKAIKDCEMEIARLKGDN